MSSDSSPPHGNQQAQRITEQLLRLQQREARLRREAESMTQTSTRRLRRHQFRLGEAICADPALLVTVEQALPTDKKLIVALIRSELLRIEEFKAATKC